MNLQKKNLKVVFLWAEPTPYLVNQIKFLCKIVESVDLVFWDYEGIHSAYTKLNNINKLKYHKRSEKNLNSINCLLEEKRPDIIVVSGWMDKVYIQACRKYKRKFSNVKIVAGIDDQWTGSLRQKLGKYYYRLFIKNIFDYMWVSGAIQFSYATHFYHKKNEIIPYLYSGNFENLENTKNNFNKFFYVGRLLNSKGVDILVEAHKKMPQKYRRKIPLHIYGEGELRSFVEENVDDYLKYHGWVSNQKITKIFSEGGIGVMPSRKEMWGVAVHEYTQLGFPLLISDVVGSANELLINGRNGFKFKSESITSLLEYMKIFCEMKNSELIKMSNASLELASQINIAKSVASLLSISY